ncbi:hypothetical protein I4U23_004968 [Adineta vaga]|nr:hypothetical protein I4U23_004968 [Adineta vaga]
MKSSFSIRLLIVLTVSLFICLIFYRRIFYSITKSNLRFNKIIQNTLANFDLSPINHQCSLEEANLLGEKYQTIYKHPWSACYSDDYLLQFYFSDMSSTDELFSFNIRANKGYTIATWLSLWFSHLNINPRTLGNYLRTELNISDCGACADCKETIFENLTFTKYIKKKMTIYAFEPQPKTFQLLDKVRKWMNVSFISTYELALSNQTGSGLLAKCPSGGETCGLSMTNDSNTRNNAIATAITTLDNFIKENGIFRKIDVLKIDAEGFDPLIIQGAENILNQHQVKILLFEYHGIGMWSQTSLFQVITNLDKKGYICYQLGKTGLFQLTSCWSSKFEKKVWSNVLCLSRRESKLMVYIEKLLIKL